MQARISGTDSEIADALVQSGAKLDAAEPSLNGSSEQGADDADDAHVHAPVDAVSIFRITELNVPTMLAESEVFGCDMTSENGGTGLSGVFAILGTSLSEQLTPSGDDRHPLNLFAAFLEPHGPPNSVAGVDRELIFFGDPQWQGVDNDRLNARSSPQPICVFQFLSMASALRRLMKE